VSDRSNSDFYNGLVRCSTYLSASSDREIIGSIFLQLGESLLYTISSEEGLVHRHHPSHLLVFIHISSLLTLESLKLLALPPNFAVLLFNLVSLFGLLDISLLQLITHQGARPSAERAADRRASARGADSPANDCTGSRA